MAASAPFVEVSDQTRTLHLSWSPEARETYAWIDRESQAVTERLEGLTADWFSANGALQSDRTSVGESDAQSSVSTAWVSARFDPR